MKAITKFCNFLIYISLILFCFVLYSNCRIPSSSFSLSSSPFYHPLLSPSLSSSSPTFFSSPSFRSSHTAQYTQSHRFHNPTGRQAQYPVSPRPRNPLKVRKAEGCNCLAKRKCPAGYGQLKHVCIAESGETGICCLQQQGFEGVQSRSHVPLKALNVSQRLVDEAFDWSKQFYARLLAINEQKIRDGDMLDVNDPSQSHNMFFQRNFDSRQAHELGFKIALTSQRLKETLQLSPDEASSELPSLRVSVLALGQPCPTDETYYCDPNFRYRSVDGYCNNLQYPNLGKRDTSYARLGSATYSDGVRLPRTHGVDGEPLPGVRGVVNTVLSTADVPDSRFTMGLMQWGQAVAHDILNTPFVDIGLNRTIKCCDDNNNIAQSLDINCFPIALEPTDNFFGPRGKRCMNFVRSMISINAGCSLGPVQQLNSVTHWLDGSFLYGSTDEIKDIITDRSTGLLRTSPNDLMPTSGSISCMARRPEFKCFFGGDAGRSNIVPTMVALHTTLIREHNRLVSALSALNPTWGPLKLYEETRRIVIAQIQHITYNEYLPSIIGQELTDYHQLGTLKSGFRNDYSPSVDGRIFNEFSSAVFRMAHSTIQGFLKIYQNIDDLPIVLPHQFMFNAPHLIQLHPSLIDILVRTMSDQSMHAQDAFFSEDISNHVFQRPESDFGMDLRSLNTQRGRDHGIASYNEMREVAGLERAKSFVDLLSTTSPDFVQRLQAVYRHVDDIDLYVGGLSESPLPGAQLGATFGALLATQFSSTMKGDRFFYDMGDQAGSFTSEQLQEIRKSSIAGIFCLNSKVESMQPKAFMTSGYRNERVPCSQIPVMDLTAFQQI